MYCKTSILLSCDPIQALNYRPKRYRDQRNSERVTKEAWNASSAFSTLTVSLFLTITTAMNQANPDAMDSPIDRMSESPPPEGILGEVESELMGLANSLYNIGTTLLADTAKDGQQVKDLGPRMFVNYTIAKPNPC
jgi:hypothetical protein